MTLLKELVDKENLLRGWSYSVEESIKAAVEYRKQLQKEAEGPQPVTSRGAGTYPLGQKPKHWK